MYEWINPTYLDMDHQIQIQEEFEEQSEILLKDFLKVGARLLSGAPCLARSLAPGAGEEASPREFLFWLECVRYPPLQIKHRDDVNS